MVEYDPETGNKRHSSKKRPKTTHRPRQEQRRPLSLDDLSDDESNYGYPYGGEEEDDPRFKYSTAGLSTYAVRNTKCCLLSMTILCVIVVVVVSIIMTRATEKATEYIAPIAAPTDSPTVAAAGFPTLEGVGGNRTL